TPPDLLQHALPPAAAIETLPRLREPAAELSRPSGHRAQEGAGGEQRRGRRDDALRGRAEPVGEGPEVLVLSEQLLEPPQLVDELPRRAAAEAEQRLERVAQPLGAHAQAVQRLGRRVLVEAAAAAQHGAEERTDERRGDRAEQIALAARR